MTGRARVLGPAAFGPPRLLLAFAAALSLGLGTACLPALTPIVTRELRATWLEQSPDPTLAPGAMTRFWIRYRNTGSATWRRGVPGKQVNLGVKGDSVEFAEANIGVGWLSADRIATTEQESVRPGEVGTFAFTLRAPATTGVYRLPLRLIVDGVGWLEDDGRFLVLVSDLGFHSQFVDQSRHPTLRPGQVSGPLTVRLRNAGTRTWVRAIASQQVRLGVARDDRSPSSMGVGWPLPDRVAIQTEPSVAPGAIATLTFRVRAPSAPGTYPLRLRPVVDGVTWMEDDGILSLITVTGAAASPAAPAATALPASSFGTSVSVDPSSVAAGAAVTLTASVTSAAATTALVGVEIHSPGGATISYRRWFENETFAAGQQRAYPVTWQVPPGAAAGRYTVSLSLYSPGWAALHSRRDGVAVVSVTATAATTPAAPKAQPAPPASPPSSSALTAPPSEGGSAPPSAAPSPAPSFTSTASVAPDTPAPAPTSTPLATATPAPAPTATRAPVPTATSAPPPTPAPTPAPTATAAPSFALGASVVPTSVVADGSVDITARVTSVSAATVIVDVNVYAPSGVRVHQQWLEDQSFAAGDQRTYAVTWQVPASAAPGTYRVALGVFSPGWSVVHKWVHSAATFSVAAAPTPTPAPTVARTPSPPGTGLLALRVQGNRLVDAAGQPVTLRGLNRAGPEYMFQYGGIFDGPSDAASIAAIKTWSPQINVVRVPLHEHVWLGRNGTPTALSGETYRQAIKSWVALLNGHGLYVILDLHWSAPGTMLARGQQPMPDVDHAPDFWTSVATAFKGNDAVIFDLFNEPFPDGNRNTATAWTTWRDGGTEYLRNTTTPYQAAGMQRLVDAVRTTGATNVIGLGGVQFANTLTGWLAHKPVDPLNNIVALWHVYNDTWQNTVAEYDATVLPVAAQVPVVATEVGTTGCDAAWFETLLRWLDANGLGYVGWGWNTWGNDCAQYSLIADYAGTPTQKGATFKDHLAGLR